MMDVGPFEYYNEKDEEIAGKILQMLNKDEPEHMIKDYLIQNMGMSGEQLVDFRNRMMNARNYPAQKDAYRVSQLLNFIISDDDELRF
tara:strand:+ start:347 stop:610 length:264 start_codon:yes stop_codon:yes gene_type:complete